MTTLAPSRRLTPPTTEVRDWDFSYTVKGSQAAGHSIFRWKNPDDPTEEYFCEEATGPDPGLFAMGEGEPNHMLLRCGLEIFETEIPGKDYTVRHARVYPPDPLDVPELTCSIVEWYEPTQTRICARREQGDMRLRNERSEHGKTCGCIACLKHVQGYWGWMNLNWLDGGPHVFHEGWVGICDRNHAHCYPLNMEDPR